MTAVKFILSCLIAREVSIAFSRNEIVKANKEDAYTNIFNCSLEHAVNNTRVWKGRNSVA
jgi:hypothetical protein